jgi:hypothetical protein
MTGGLYFLVGKTISLGGASPASMTLDGAAGSAAFVMRLNSAGGLACQK